MENEKSELTGGYRSGEPSSGSDIPISSRVDPTGVMPVFDEGRAVDSMGVEEAQVEWNKMTVDSEGKYDNFPRSVFLKRRDLLWEKGFSEKLANEKKTREEESRKWLTEENERISERDDKQARNKSMDILRRRFGSEKGADVAIQRAQKVIERIAEDSRDGGESLIDYLDTTRMGDDPILIEALTMLSTNKPLMNRLAKVNEGMAGGGVIELLVEVAKTLGIGGKKKR